MTPKGQVLASPILALTQSIPLLVTRLLPIGQYELILTASLSGGVLEKYSQLSEFCLAKMTVVDGKQQILVSKLVKIEALIQTYINRVQFFPVILDLRAIKVDLFASVVRVSVQGVKILKQPSFNSKNLSLTQDTLGIVNVEVAGQVLAVRSSGLLLFCTNRLILLMFWIKQGLEIIFTSNQSRKDKSVKVELSLKLKQPTLSQETFGNELVGTGICELLVQSEEQMSGLALKKVQVFTSCVRMLAKRSILLRIILDVDCAICVLETRLKVSFSVLEMLIMSFEIFPKRTSMMESVKMRSRQVLRVKMMIIFFQKLS